MLAAVDWVSAIVATYWSLAGSSVVTLAYIFDVSAPLSVVSAVMSALTIPIIKISVAIMLLRLLQGKFWKWFLFIIIGVQVVMAIFVTLMHTTRCVPINALWDMRVKAKMCWGSEAFRLTFTATSIVTIVTDIILSLIPLTFILQIRRPVPERVIIAFLMGLGIFASAASIAKTVIIQFYSDTGADGGQLSGLKIALWASLEEQIGLIAACLPCLKSVFHRALQRVGLLSMTRSTETSNMSSVANARRSVSIRTHIEAVRHKPGHLREDIPWSDEEGLVDLAWKSSSSVEMKCIHDESGGRT